MRVVFTILAAIILMLAVFIALYQWDSSRNRGSSFGYFGEYNRVSNALASIPGITVTQGWHNHDVTLEEFGFGITAKGEPVRLFFGERDPVRNIGREADISALQRRIETSLHPSALTNEFAD